MNGLRHKNIFSLLLALTCSLYAIADLYAQAEPFYKGKRLTIVVGLSAGGGYDRAARLISRHLGKHIPETRKSSSRI